MKKKISDYGYNVYSQFGDDGVIDKIFQILGTTSRICIEFGAWDGFHFSNTANLLTSGWKGILIEAEEEKYEKMVSNTRKYDCICIKTFVTAEGPNTIENILRREKIENEIDLLSIDIDGDDYHIFESIKTLKPRLIICEFNPTIPVHMDLVPEKDNFFGCSLLSLVKLAEKKDYKLVATTDTNSYFVREEDIGKFIEFNLKLESLAPMNHLTYFITGYGGDYFLSQKPTYGCNFPSEQKFIKGECVSFPKSVFTASKKRKYNPVRLFKRILNKNSS